MRREQWRGKNTRLENNGIRWGEIQCNSNSFLRVKQEEKRNSYLQIVFVIFNIGETKYRAAQNDVQSKDEHDNGARR
jgi:hypothetical protein